MTDRSSLETCDRWIEELRKTAEPDCVVVAVGNKIDLREYRQISTEEAREHFERMEPPVPYFETSAKTGEGVDELFDSVVQMIVERHTELMNNDNENTDEDGGRTKQKDDKCIIC